MVNLGKVLRHYADIVRYTMDHWLDGLPSVTVVCYTYGRPHLLPEAVESILRQDYKGHLETLILNDQPELKYISTVDNVKVVNKDERYSSFPEKRKAALKMPTTDLAMNFSDDDILMPWAVSTAVSAMVSHIMWLISGHVRYNQKRNVATYFPKAPLPGPCLYNVKFVKKIDLEQSHKPPGFEMQLVRDVHKNVPKGFGPLIFKQSKQLPPDKVYYMVRSGLPNHRHFNNNSYEKYGDFVKGLGLSGEVEIKPHWERDYVSIFKDAVQRKMKSIAA